tara:strand:- start:1105 stop:1830 length:726 start_codon:yes stop_codon:yes gene_type:complete
MAFYDSRVSKLYVAQYDLTSFTREMSEPGDRPLRDVTVLGDSGHKWFPGTEEGKASWAGLFDDGASGSDAILDHLRSATAANVITVWPGDTVLGNTGFGTGEGWSTGPDIKSTVGDMVTMSADLELGAVDRIKSLGPLVSKTADFSGSSIDDSASSSSGGSWFYHITTWTTSGGTLEWKIILEDSADDAAWATVGSESVTLTAVGAARRAFTGTLRRYVRITVDLVATSGTLEFIAGYERL